VNESWAVIYGLIQGITEFLPISSSGHLALIPSFFELKDPGVIFDLVMHVGTALAVIVYFRKDVLRLLGEFKLIVVKKDIQNTGFFFQNFILATMVSFICILLIKDIALANGRSSTFIAINLIFFGILMFISDLKKDTNVNLVEKRDFKRSILIGFSQSLAIFPGVSRSGITLTASRFSGMDRLQASRFSFLLSLPIIAASVAYKLPAILKGDAITVELSVVLIGVIVSFVVGLVTIHFFLQIIAKMGLWAFMVYRVVLGLIILYVM